MLFDRDRRSPEQTGDRSICPTCAGALLAKCGALVIPHWAHIAARDCDPWDAHLFTDAATAPATARRAS